MSGYIGAIPTPQATQSRDVYTATSNQTTFTTQGYTPGFVSVYLNGVHLARADFTATNGSDVVLASGATADDVVEIISFGTFQSADALPLTGGTMTGDLIIPDGDLILGSTAVTATAAEINLIDGGTARGTTAVADGDGVLVNDAGTMRMTNVTTLATYMGTKITGGSLVYLASSGAISNAATISFTQFDSTKYDSYKFYLYYVIPATDTAKLTAIASVDGGSNYSTTNGDYHKAGGQDHTSFIIHETGIGSAANEFGVCSEFTIWNPDAATYTYAHAETVLMDSNAARIYAGGTSHNVVSQFLSTNEMNAIRFVFTSGNIESGEIVMYGIANGT